MPDRLRDTLAGLGALLLGVVGYLVYCSPVLLDPGNMSWLNAGDRAMHTLGWMFFRAAPWSSPPGDSPNLGIELANSIGLVDGLPIFAIPLKLIRDWLPDPFQYWGIWLLVVFALQGLFAYLLARALGAGRLVGLCAAAFALITPAFLFRVPMHMALSGHFVVLAALWLYVRAPVRPWAWTLLIGATAGIHAYLLAMVFGVWAAAIVQRLWLRQIPLRTAVVEAVLVSGASFLMLWAAGFFASGTFGNYGYGWYKLNLLWPFIAYAWSQVFPAIGYTRFDYEGISFLGVGIFALIAVALASGALARLRTMISPRWLPLVVVLVLMMLFAVTTQPAIANLELFHLPLPKALEDILSTFRSTGRFIWPLLYLITVGAVVLVGLRLRAAIAVPLVLAALAAQVVDSFPAWRAVALSVPPPSPVWATTMVSPLWARFPAAGYTRIRAIPLEVGYGTDWKDPGYFAVTHGMAIDMAYLGRVDTNALAALEKHEADVLSTGAFEPTALYILDPTTAPRVARLAKPTDLLATVDGRIVFARNAAALVEGLGIGNDAAPRR